MAFLYKGLLEVYKKMVIGIFFSCIFACFFSYIAEYNGIYRPGKIYKFAITLLVSSGLLILLTANRTGYDARNYQMFYKYIALHKKNPWDYSYKFYSKLTMFFQLYLKNRTYFEFQAIILVIIGCFMVPRINRLSLSYSMVVFLYLISGVFASDGMQFKNFIAVCFLIMALEFLQRGQGAIGIVKYIILIGIACLFHFSCVIYFVLPVVKNSFFQRIRVVFPVIGLIFYIVFLFGGQELLSVFLPIISKVPGLSKLAGYANSFAGARSLVPVMLYFIGLILLYLCRYNRKILPKKLSDYNNLITNIWILMGIFLPTLAFANAPYRFYRNLYIPIFIVISNYLVSLRGISQKKSISSLFVLVYVLSIFLYPIALGQARDIYAGIFDGTLFWR